MIPTENLYKEERFKFGGTYCRWTDVVNHIFSYIPLSYEQSLGLRDSFRSIAEENLIFPLEFIKSGRLPLPKDEKGCRIYDWKILSTPQVRTAMRIGGHSEMIRVAHAPPISRWIEMTDSSSPIPMPEIEVYDKFLNVTYLVNDEFLQEWCHPTFSEKNIAKKTVKDCTVSELLFAVNKKLDKFNT